jgi:osmotically-inducible protein OsmY
MPKSDEMIKQAHAALEQQPRVNLHRYPITITAASDDSLTLEGEVESVAAKKIALELTAAVAGVAGVVDRLRVAPSRAMGDGEISDHVRDALLEDGAFARLAIRVREGGKVETASQPDTAGANVIEIAVQAGVVTLDGRVPSYSHKALAGVLAWWVPGTRDVVNGLEIVPPQEITDGDITDVLALVLERNPLVNADGITLRTRDLVVTLEGEVATEQESIAAEEDAWCIFAVNRVINHLSVHH